ncbi:MAG: NAD-dependent epimerase/dehydratase family protein [Planctomycetes bacterium]|nr:NAD-dependent epimerase/dehydratase family protein [Planctomycetota bacterium]MCC7399652.1 NAD-dependent epimerase/dehydratase family protein [Planctomycetota bacterium]
MSKRPVALVTGANGEIGRSLIETLHRDGRYRVVTLDLSPLPEKYRPLCFETYAGNILDRYLLDQLAAHHEIEAVFHLAALLSTRGERDPELAHQINVEGTLHLLRMAQSLTLRLDRPVKFLFPSSIAAYGIPTLAEKNALGRVREDQGLEPITMYGINKLYAEHLGRYFMRHYRMLSANSERAIRLDFRSVRFPGLISSETVPSGGTSDYGPEMLHAAAQNKPYACFVAPEAQIPFMAMPDAIKALMLLLDAPREKLTLPAYNVGAFNPTAAEFAARVKKAFPRAQISFEIDPARARIVDSWPADVDDSKARRDWGWSADYGIDRAFDELLIPAVRARYRD